MNESSVQWWCQHFNAGKENVHVDKWTGRMSVIVINHQTIEEAGSSRKAMGTSGTENDDSLYRDNKFWCIFQNLKKIGASIQNRRQGVLSNRVLLFHYNVWSLSLWNQTVDRSILTINIWSPPPPNEYHLFTKLKYLIGGMHFDSDGILKKTVFT